jgi:hypothetical protein
VAGCLLRSTAGVFDTRWSQGTPIKINGVPTLIYRVISANVLEVYDNLGAQTSVRYEIPEPYLVGQALPVVFGSTSFFGTLFGVGDTLNPGRLYYLTPNNPDAHQSTFWLDVTDPSDPLMNGVVWNGRAYLWSSQKMFAIIPQLGGTDGLFGVEEIPGTTGLFAPWACCAGDMLYWGGKDGVYASEGGSARNITRKDLQPLFPTESTPGASTFGIGAPDISAAQSANLRLSWSYDKFLYFDYVDTGGARRTLLLDKSAGDGEGWGWWYDTYTPGVVFHYAEEGENVRNIVCGGANAGTAQLYSLGGATRTDNGTAVASQVRTFSFDGNDARPEKIWQDVSLDVDPGGTTIAPTIGFNNFSGTPANIVGAAITGSGRVNPPPIIDLNAGSGQYARNIALDLTWSVSSDSHVPALYIWGPSYLDRPEDTIKRATDYSDLGYGGPKYIRGLNIEADTQGLTKSVLIEYTKDDGTVGGVTVPVTTSQKTIYPIAFAAPFVAYEVRIRPSDSFRWKYFQVVDWQFDKYTDLKPLITEWSDLGDPGTKWIQGVLLHGDTNNLPVTVTVQKDFGITGYVLNGVQHNGEGVKEYSFEPPFLSHMVRMVPTTGIRILPKSRFVFTPESDLGATWETQETTFGFPGYSQLSEITLSVASTVNLDLIVYADGVATTYSGVVLATGSTSTFKSRRIVLSALKARQWKFRLRPSDATTPFRVRKNDTVVLGKPWGSNFEFDPLRPFGGTHFGPEGAAI